MTDRVCDRSQLGSSQPEIRGSFSLPASRSTHEWRKWAGLNYNQRHDTSPYHCMTSTATQ